MKTLRQALDRIEELEGILGLKHQLPNKLELTELQNRMIGVLVNRPIIDRDSMFTLLYGHLPESQQPSERKVVEVHMVKLRRKMAAHGYTIKNIWGIGYYLEEEAREQLRRIMRLDAERQVSNGKAALKRLSAADNPVLTSQAESAVA